MQPRGVRPSGAKKGECMTFDPTNPYYYMYPILGMAVFALLYFVLRARRARTQNVVLFLLLAANFALHFLKLLFPPYNTEGKFDYYIQTITPENVCAINTMIFPFLFLSKNGALRDYMFYIGVISGIAASWIPMSIDDAGVFDFDTIRYYSCHTVLWAVPLLMVVLGRHKLNYRRIIFVPLIYILDLVVIVANESLLVALGLEKANQILSYGNGGMAFAPYHSLEDTAILDFLLIFVPSWFKPSAENANYAPALWQLGPAVILGCPLGFLMCLYWEWRHFFDDVKRLFLFLSRPFTAYRFGRRKIKFYGAEKNRVRGRRVRAGRVR